VGNLRILRRAAVAAAVVGAVAASVSTASAATHTQAQVMQSARHAFARTLPSTLRPAALTQSTTSVPAGSFLELFTQPASLPAINGKVYHMSLDAYTETDSFGVAPELDVSLYRIASANGQPVGEQDHEYSYTSTDVDMSADTGLTNLVFNSKRAFRPTRVNMAFTPTQARSTRCTLFTGGHGTLTGAVGTLDAKSFKIHTGTSPFFGDITTAPQQAFAFSDPGCESGEIQLAGTRTSVAQEYYQPCAGRESISAGSAFGVTQWDAEVGFGGKHAYLFSQTGSMSTTQAQVHFAVGVQSSSGMPVPRHSRSGATATLNAQGNPEFGGQATFVSHYVPRTSSVQTCTYERHLHRFVATRYAGTLTPSSTNPFAVLFDTGAIDFQTRSATLVIRHFIS
jgi:hypothetical protein